MKNKIYVIATAGVILIGIIIVAVLGFKVDYSYKQYSLVSVQIGQEFKVADIKSITDEIFPKEKVEIKSSGVYSDTLILNVNGINDEQKEKLSTKLNEKYGLETTAESINVKVVPKYRLRDIAKSFILPMLIASIVGLVYMSIRYRKIGIVKVIGQFIILNALAEALYVSVIAITRFPVNRLVMPGSIAIFFIITTFLACGFEKQIKSEKE